MINKNSYKRLTKYQKKFIRNKVSEFNSMDEVDLFYSKRDLVSRYAKKMFKELKK